MLHPETTVCFSTPLPCVRSGRNSPPEKENGSNHAALTLLRRPFSSSSSHIYVSDRAHAHPPPPPPPLTTTVQTGPRPTIKAVAVETRGMIHLQSSSGTTSSSNNPFSSTPLPIPIQPSFTQRWLSSRLVDPHPFLLLFLLLLLLPSKNRPCSSSLLIPHK